MDINDDRKIDVFQDLIDWVYDHSYDDEDFVTALEHIGFTDEEINIIIF